MMILAITYTSRATDLHTEEMRLKLMRECELRNVTQDVTGLLLYQEGHFLQYIEGEPETIRATFARIQCDPRHHDVTLHSEEVLMQRQFPDWSMFYRDYDFIYPHVQMDLGELVTLAKVIEALDDKPELRQVMFDFLKKKHDGVF
jgi:hypothetical protein